MECRWTSLWLATLVLASSLSTTISYSITVDAHAEECFFENVEADTKMGLTFEIAEGGFLDIDVTITGPDGAVIHRGERESSGMYTFSAHMPGRYTYCFSNKMSTMTPKVVMFNLEVGAVAHKAAEEKPNHNKLEDMIKELGNTLKTVKHEQEYMQGSPLSGCRHECESNDECGLRQSCIDFQCRSSCSGCSVNADCETVRGRTVCKCPRGYHGDPYRICTAECSSDGECPSYKPACVCNACVNPCTNACGTNADCNLRGLTPVCSCLKGHTGDPFTYCRPFEARELCEPNPCGRYADCTPGYDRTGVQRPVCTCPAGYTGDALVACNKAAPEHSEGKCELDSQCTDRLVCIGSQCVDPCLQPNRLCSTEVCMASCAVLYPPASDRQTSATSDSAHYRRHGNYR